jgi:hypothetical protein
MAAASAAGGVSPLPPQQAGRIRGFDHVALPMENTGEMLAFYRGCDVIESATACSVHFGDNMINFHRPAHSLASGGLKNREPYVTVARRFSG